jgi:hypothetical protein
MGFVGLLPVPPAPRADRSWAGSPRTWEAFYRGRTFHATGAGLADGLQGKRLTYRQSD